MTYALGLACIALAVIAWHQWDARVDADRALTHALDQWRTAKGELERLKRDKLQRDAKGHFVKRG